MINILVEHDYPGFSLSAQFTAPRQGITVLYGPSGSGKTTILKAVAGLFRPDRFTLDFAGEKLHRIAAERRRFGTVFQDGRLFPHLTVRGNLLYGIRRAPRHATKGGPGQIYVDDVVGLLGLGDLLRRRPATLSGGERQRVAIGRALLSQPRLLLMDEPLASLDAARQEEILPYLQRLRDDLHIPILYVTHAMDEVVRLADHVVLLHAGRVMGQGSLTELASRVDLPLARRDDSGGVLRGFLHSHDDERRLSAIACGGLVFLVPRLNLAPQSLVRLRIPAREVVIARDVPQEISVSNVLPAVVSAIGRDEAGHAALVELDVGGGQLLSRITLDAADRLGLEPGMHVTALVKAVSVETLG
jgi:molybdate transport system ATP-binding protein